ncbi:MAG: hypothetical protein RMJ18_02690 [Candidatus Aenigmarchaeota archaeon]|nr:hypothetical protein [Candidatus Aenigmarchaeota archaeon]MCX8191046.1 hypothetical protein [Candidatus Aenigmarchaeota archaeon]MDW8160298.1 hypothetical protein [Candidatus Aenigmarchaeota archaeon]
MSKIFPIILDEELDKKIKEYMLKKGIRAKKDAILELIRRGLEK